MASAVHDHFPPELLPFRCDDEGHPTLTSQAQAETEDECAGWYADDAGQSPVLLRSKHVAYLNRCLDGLPSSFAALDASRTWILYWIVHALDLLGASPSEHYHGIVEFLRRCQCATGGFGGGPQQGPHTAATYAAVLALLAVGTPEAYAAIDRRALLSFYMSVKDPASGGFRVQAGGEMDVRGTYTVLAVSRLLGLDAAEPALTTGCAEFLLSCQSYEGGFGGEPGNEAHGGYTFCAVAALALLGALHRCDLPALSRWLAGRQMPLEGGLQGRTNKLVDSCYSFWQGAVFALLPPPPVPVRRRPLPGSGLDAPSGSGDGTPSSAAAPSSPQPLLVEDDMLLDRRRLQAYLLACCQAPDGGLRDKPGKGRDMYHTCYALSGLAVAQRDRHGGAVPGLVLGGAPNALHATHPVFNLRRDRVDAALEHFGARPLHQPQPQPGAVESAQ